LILSKLHILVYENNIFIRCFELFEYMLMVGSHRGYQLL
jgi:hypothetical protein